MEEYQLYVSVFFEIIFCLCFLPAPCPLTTFMPTVNCNTSIVAVAWNYTSLSDVLHTVTAVDAAGRQHNCSGVSSSGCDLTTLDCGTKYNLTVTPSRNGCGGRDSPTKTITTGEEHFFLSI